MNKPLELLAPAKDKKCAISAINCGADAIYIGAPAFGARRNASNTLDDIKEVVEHAHKFFVRVYVALNTILKDEDLNSVQKMLYELYEIGVDGIIVQDFGIFTLDIPPFLISASTQCDIRDVEKVKFFEKLGLDRVILARELPLRKIKEICSSTNIEVETFVHGALCVCYSGQCYLSYALGSRSANRGECAQPCRKKYTLVDEDGKIYAKNKHLLSLKDFCAAPYLDDLVNCGVVSFKIEGRLKDENYVKNVCAYYNLLLDKYKRVSSGKVFYDFKPNINKTFNRGYCSYFLDDKGENIYNFDTPKQVGEFVGCVCSCTKNFIEIKTKNKINRQDGLCYFDNNNLCGFLVNRVEYENDIIRIFPNSVQKIKKGTKIFRNFDFEFDKQLKNSKTKRQIGVRLCVNDDKICAIDEDECTFELNFNDCTLACDKQKMQAIFETQLKKTGESDFYIQAIEFNCSNLPFLKVSQINSLRRELFEGLMLVRLEKYKKIRAKRQKKKILPVKFPLKNNDYRLNVHNKAAKEFYRMCQVECSEDSYETKKINNAELMRTKHCLRRAFDFCRKKCEKNLRNKRLFLIDENGRKIELEFDCKNCEMVLKF